jgi:prophage maintenance system killer protein
MAKKELRNKGVVVYQAKSGAIELRTDARNETFWLTQQQVANVFNVQRAAISKHVKNIFASGELDRKSTVSKMETVQIEGSRKIKRGVEYYNLDLTLSIGYRVNSKQATAFRQWATKTLRSYIIDGYAVNKKRIAQNYEQFLIVVRDIQKLLPEESSMSATDAMEIVSLFADTWLSLDAYDKDMLPTGKLTKKRVALTAEKVEASLAGFKRALLDRGEASELFGAERHAGSVAGIVGNVMQSFGGKELYPTAEEKAAHLLYFMVKNHPFSDGNKRSGAYAFVWFLRHAGILDVRRLTPSALTALTILVAESDPSHKERIVRLVIGLIGKKNA